MLLMRMAAAALLAAAAACSPTLDWRELRLAGSGVTLLLPCRPSAQVRSVQLAGRSVQLSLQACSAGGQTWALAFADVGDPAVLAPALDALRAAAQANLGATDGQTLPLAVPGATPNAASRRVLLNGKLPDGKAVQEQVAVFTHGTLVFQATVLGESLPADGVETFFGSLRFSP